MLEYLDKFFKNRKLSLEKFNSVIGAVLVEGVLASLLAATLLGGVISLLMKTWLLVICYIVLCMVGVYITYKSDNPKRSFLGYNIVMISTGIFFKVITKSIAAINIAHIHWLLVGVLVVIFIAVKLMPRVLLKVSRAIKVTLIGLVIVGIIAFIAGWFKTSWWDVVIAALLSLYFGYIWAKAQRNELTVDGAIDGCLGLYIGIGDLFARIADPASGRAGNVMGKVKKGREELKNLFQED